MRTVALEYRQCAVQKPKPPHSGVDALVDGFIGRFRRRRSQLELLRHDAEAIDQKQEDWKFLSDGALRRHLAEFREKFRRRARGWEALVPDALAAIREAADRAMHLRPFTVQIMGALALNRGYIAEMATGEGKTLTAALAAVLAGWTGRPCHIVTVNDYLAQRDADWLRPLYEFCAVSVGCVTSVMGPEDRARGYAQDVTYTTSKEVTADFLRDRLRLGDLQQPTRRMLHRHLAPHEVPEGAVMRGLHTAIVDEADSVLIDEAVTPLIISAARERSEVEQIYSHVWQIASQLREDVDYRVDLRYKEVTLLPEGSRRVDEAAGAFPERWRGGSRPVELVEQALTAREFFRKGKQYVVDGGKVVIVDEFSGRMMPMRKWRHGLHQAIEAKEALPISAMDHTLARISFQRFFRLYRQLAGMTGTASEAAGELWHIYHLPVVRIPTNRPVVRVEHPDRYLADAESKLEAVVAEVTAVHRAGRPVLVGTRSIATSQELASRLRQRGFTLNLLNAMHDREEAKIVSEAGQPAMITIATNMAGRGTDIILGPGVAEAGGLHVIATERHESHRIDRQLYGRAARQGDPGSAVAFVSIEDELLRRFSPGFARRFVARSIRQGGKFGPWLGRKLSSYVQWRAESQAFHSRKAVMRMDVWIDEAVSFSGAGFGP